MIRRKAALIDASGAIICDTYIKFGKNDSAILTKDTSFQPSKVIKNGKVRFLILGSYMEFYNGSVYKMDADHLYIQDIIEENEKKINDVKINMKYDTNITFYENDNLKSCLIHLRDLSSGGLCFSTNVCLDDQKVYELILLLTKEPVLLNLKIVRCIKQDMEERYIYGCKFIDMDPDMEKLLRNTVFWLLGLKYKHNFTKYREAN